MAKEKDPKRVAAGRKSRTKGANAERQLAKLFATWWGKGEWARTPLSGGWATKEHREGFAVHGDIITTAKDFKFSIENKKQEGWTLDQLLHNEKCIILDWWKQACDETPKELVPLLVISRNHIPPSVVFSANWVTNRIWKFTIANDPCLPHEHLKHMEYDTGEFGDNLTIMTLEDFFKINPKYMGRIDDVGTTTPVT